VTRDDEKIDRVEPIEVSDFSPKLREYALFGGIERVAGWLESGALAMLLFLSKQQASQGVSGSVAEIGVHHGRLFVALCLLRREDENAIGIDVFEDQHLNVDGSGRGSREHLESHLMHFVGDDPRIAIAKADSLHVRPDEVRDWLDQQPVRLFSVDGCHTAEHTESDLILAEAVLAPGGIIVLDDFDNAEWPTVHEGGESALAGPLAGKIEPIAYGNNKLLLAAPPWAELYRKILLEAVPLEETSEPFAVAGRPCAKVSAPPLEHWLSDAAWRELVGPGSGRERFSSDATDGVCRLEEGWSDREAWGVWSDGAESRVLVPVGSDASGFEVSLAYHPFLVPERRSLRIDAYADGSFLDSWTADTEGRQSRRLRVARPSHASRWLELRLVYDAPISPADLGDPGDGRALAIGLEEIRWRPQEA